MKLCRYEQDWRGRWGIIEGDTVHALEGDPYEAPQRGIAVGSLEALLRQAERPLREGGPRLLAPCAVEGRAPKVGMLIAVKEAFLHCGKDLIRSSLWDPAAQIDRSELRQLLDEALLTLSEAQRQTFVLHAEAGLSYREVADVMNISIGTVMSRLFYARQKLRAWLARKLVAQT